ncbi:hypothetical protein C5167_004682 [Papaver somniferum]|uniref:Uncharacterized protein n=1 Tax=Papaver somniferum TaxID=3469 RepID=A0A4Y7JC54_PAPSO|nr:hypothetical protein C5167_004682 [Papaver somniferum]
MKNEIERLFEIGSVVDVPCGDVDVSTIVGLHAHIAHLSFQIPLTGVKRKLIGKNICKRNASFMEGLSVVEPPF